MFLRSRAVVTTVLLLLPFPNESSALSPTSREAPKPALTFSSTQVLAPMLAQYTRATLPEGKVRLEDVSEPPANDSVQTKSELESLLLLQRARDGRDLEVIVFENGSIPWLGPFPLDDIMQVKSPVSDLVTQLMHVSAMEIYSRKLRFDRVRPIFLEPRLVTVIETPGHPAYPSGHATQYILYALALSEVAPTSSKVIMCDALHVAIRRELAAVHYASDSEAGRRLAEILFDEWKKKPGQRAALEDARKWWNENGARFVKSGDGRWNRRFAHRRVVSEKDCTFESIRKSYLSKRARGA